MHFNFHGTVSHLGSWPWRTGKVWHGLISHRFSCFGLMVGFRWEWRPHKTKNYSYLQGTMQAGGDSIIVWVCVYVTWEEFTGMPMSLTSYHYIALLCDHYYYYFILFFLSLWQNLSYICSLNKSLVLGHHSYNSRYCWSTLPFLLFAHFKMQTRLLFSLFQTSFIKPTTWLTK